MDFKGVTLGGERAWPQKPMSTRFTIINFATLYDYITKDLGASLYRDNIQVTIMAI